MRAQIGRIALAAIVTSALCGCKSAGDMFAWGRKKPSDNYSEAPKFADANPTLPTAGQSPGATPSNVNGTVAASMPAYGSVDNPSANSPYGAQAATYQQAVYPTTPFPPANLPGAGGVTPASGVSNVAPGNVAANSTPNNATVNAATPWNSGASGAPVTPAYGPNAASTAAAPNVYNGTGPTAYNNAGSSATQPQVGQYTTSGGANPTAPMNTPYGQNNAATGVAATTPPMQDYRTADARGAQSNGLDATMATAAAPSQVAPMNAMPPADAMSNSGAPTYLGDRYAVPPTDFAMPAGDPSMTNNAAATGATNAGGDRYAMPADTLAPTTTPPAPSQDMAPSRGGFSMPGATNDAGSTTTRPDPNYRPGGTSTLQPRASLQNNEPTSNPGGDRYPGVVAASFETPVAPAAPSAPAAGNSAAPTGETSGGEVYGPYGGSAAPAPNHGASNTTSQTGFFPGHTF